MVQNKSHLAEQVPRSSSMNGTQTGYIFDTEENISITFSKFPHQPTVVWALHIHQLTIVPVRRKEDRLECHRHLRRHLF